MEIQAFLRFTAQVRPLADSQAKPYAGQFMLCKVLGTLQTICIKPVRVSLAHYLYASQMSIRCKVRVFKLQKLQIPPPCNVYLVLNKRVTVFVH